MRSLRFFTLLLFGTLLAAPALRAADADAGKDCPTCRAFLSQALGMEKTFHIFLPPGYEENKDRRYPVIYLLHGYNFARNNPDQSAPAEEGNHWVQQENIPQIAGCLMTKSDFGAVDACLAEQGVAAPNDVAAALKQEYPDITLPIPPMIIVMPDGDNSFYMNRPDGKKLWPPLDGPDYVDGVYKGATGQHETYIAVDLVKHIDETFRTLAGPGHRGIGGFSMGGIGSMFLLLRHPDVFTSVTSHSAVYTLSDWTTDPLFLSYATQTTPEIVNILTGGSGKAKDLEKETLKAYDPYYLLRDFDNKDVHIYFDAGEKDAFAGMKDFQTLKKFAAGLEKKGLASQPAQHIIPATDGNGNGMHTGRYWRSRVGVALAFHARAFGLMDPATGLAVPDAQLTPDALGRALCSHGMSGDVRGIMNLVHPVQLEDFLASARDQGMDPEQFLAMIETEARKRPLKSCEVLDTAEFACEPGGGAYESPAGAARNLAFERCGTLYIRIVQDEEETTEQQIPAMKIQGRWHIDVPR